MEGEEQAAAWTEAPEPVQVTTHSNGYLELRLNRTAKFNSLDTEMLEIISRALDDHLGSATGIVLSAAPGRAFCAGGDIKHVVSLPAEERRPFLHLEYSVHSRLQQAAAQGLPVIAVGDGIIMGAGAGLFMAASVRIVSERTVFAMPEVQIGLCPDAGALHFLNQGDCHLLAPWLALTGCRLNARDTLDSGLATHFVPSAATPAMVEQLQYCPSAEHLVVVDRHEVPCTTRSVLTVANQTLAECFLAGGDHFSDLQAILAKLEAEVERARMHTQSNGWRTREYAEQTLDVLEDALTNLRKASPDAVLAASLGMALARNNDLSPDVARGLELVINSHLALRPDFAEGVACTVGDRRGTTPQWTSEDIAAASEGPEAALLRKALQEFDAFPALTELPTTAS